MRKAVIGTGAMPNLDFYAIGRDLDEVLEFVFGRSRCRVFEAYSPYDTELAEFHRVADIKARYSLGACQGRGPSVLLELWPIDAPDAAFAQRIELKPSACAGATFRFQLVGWGLIQLQLGGLGPDGIVASHTNHNSEARAQAWESVYFDSLGPFSAWDWTEVVRVSRQLNSHVRRNLTVAKIGSRPVLKCAAETVANGANAH